VKLRVKRTQAGVALEGSVPEEIAGAEAAEIFPLRGGMYLFAVAGAIDGAGGGRHGAVALSGEEKALLKKLLAIRFERRTPDEVGRALSAGERGMLASLAQRNVVTVFRSRKYEKGVYNVSDAAFGQAREGDAGHAASGAAPQQAAMQDPLARGWLVLENEGDARRLSGALAGRIAAGEVSGLKAFDRKYYFIKKSFAAKWRPKLLSALEKGGRTAEELAGEAGLDAEGCRALLLHMGEEGELLEKGRGRFALA